MEQNKTSLGLEPNIEGLLCYLVGWITGVLFFLVEKENSFVRFHAMQSILVFGAITILHIVISIIQGILYFVFGGVSGYGIGVVITGIFGLIFTLISIFSLILWILLMYKAYQNESYKLPILGKIAENYAVTKK